MIKLLLWIVLVLVALFALRLLNFAKSKQRGRGGDGHPGQSPPAQAMVRCARCGVYLPRADAKAGPAGLTCGDPDCAQRQ